MEPQFGYVRSGGASLYYEESGAGFPVVLLHGFGFDRRMWNPQLPALETERRVIRYDLRGFGKSTPGPEPYTHVADLEALLDALKIDSADLMGLSLGGGAALNFAILHPDRVRSLILADPSLGGFRWSQASRSVSGAAAEMAKREGVAAARARWGAASFWRVAAGKPDVAKHIASMVDEYSGWHWLHPDLGQTLKPPAIERLEQVKARTLVLVGERDSSDFQDIAATIETRIPGARKIVIPNAGHLTNLESPDEFNQSLLAFLSEVDHSGSAVQS